MILQNLIEYYESYTDKLPPFGFEYKEISFVILLNATGAFLDIQDTRNSRGEGQKMLVPQSVKRSGTGAHPNFLWDNIKYIFGIGDAEDTKQQQALKEKKQSFLDLLEKYASSLQENPELRAVIHFLKNLPLKELTAHPLWKLLINPTIYLSFSIEATNRLVCQNPSLIETLSTLAKNSENKPEICLVTGKPEPIARLHPLIQGVYGAQGSGANLISYNLASADSYNKEQGYNAPIGQTAAFAYATALNHLLESPLKVALNQTMSLFFWSKPSSSFEKLFTNFFKPSPEKSTPTLLQECETENENSLPFFIYAISPNGGRLSLRFFWTGSIGELKKHIKQHFDDLKIETHTATQNDFSIYSLLQAFSPCRDIKHVPPRLAGEFISNLLQGKPYPYSLLSTLLKRLSDEEGLSYRRIALIKAYLNQSTLTEKIPPCLDLSRKNMNYLLGRLFAVLEFTQKQRQKTKRFLLSQNAYQRACISPKKTFPYLLEHHTLHLSEIPSAHYNYFSKLKTELLQSITHFPTNLSLSSQGEFAVGYYQQKQKLFLEIKKKTLYDN